MKLTNRTSRTQNLRKKIEKEQLIRAVKTLDSRDARKYIWKRINKRNDSPLTKIWVFVISAALAIFLWLTVNYPEIF